MTLSAQEENLAALQAAEAAIRHRLPAQGADLQFVYGSLPVTPGPLTIRHDAWPGSATIYIHRTVPGGWSTAAPGQDYRLRFLVYSTRPLQRSDAYVAERLNDVEAVAEAVARWREEITGDYLTRQRAVETGALAAGPARMAALQKLAVARRQAAATAEQLVVVEDAPPLGARSEGAPSNSFDGAVTIAALRRLIAIHFPRDAQGKLALGVTVLLAPRDPAATRNAPHLRALWYTATGPERRRDPQVIRLGWRWCLSENHTHSWDETPWLWEPTAAATATDAQRYGASDLPWERLGQEDCETNLAALSEDETPAGRIARTILLQDLDRIAEAMELWRIGLSDDVRRLLVGQRFDPDVTYTVRETLAKAAFWRFAELVTAEKQRLEEWRTAKKGRARKPVALPLFMLPHETGASRKRLFLGAGEDGATPALSLGSTASEARLPLALWQRPIETDLRRFGLWEENDT